MEVGDGLRSIPNHRLLTNLLFSQKTTQCPTNPLFLHPIQAKMMLGGAHDQYEQEADRVAKQVVNQLHRPISQASQTSSETRPIQRQTALSAIEVEGQVSTELESSISQAKGSGHSLPNYLQGPVEQVLNVNLRGVRCHTDAQADQLNRVIHARAFTIGQDVFFRRGEYHPGSRSGQELIAHELTHVVQQTKQGNRENKLTPSSEQSLSSLKTPKTPVLQPKLVNANGQVLTDLDVTQLHQQWAHSSTAQKMIRQYHDMPQHCTLDVLLCQIDNVLTRLLHALRIAVVELRHLNSQGKIPDGLIGRTLVLIKEVSSARSRGADRLARDFALLIDEADIESTQDLSPHTQRLYEYVTETQDSDLLIPTSELLQNLHQGVAFGHSKAVLNNRLDEVVGDYLHQRFEPGTQRIVEALYQVRTTQPSDEEEPQLTPAATQVFLNNVVEPNVHVFSQNAAQEFPGSPSKFNRDQGYPFTHRSISSTEPNFLENIKAAGILTTLEQWQGTYRDSSIPFIPGSRDTALGNEEEGIASILDGMTKRASQLPGPGKQVVVVTTDAEVFSADAPFGKTVNAALGVYTYNEDDNVIVLSNNLSNPESQIVRTPDPNTGIIPRPDRTVVRAGESSRIAMIRDAVNRFPGAQVVSVPIHGRAVTGLAKFYFGNEDELDLTSLSPDTFQTAYRQILINRLAILDRASSDLEDFALEQTSLAFRATTAKIRQLRQQVVQLRLDVDKAVRQKDDVTLQQVLKESRLDDLSQQIALYLQRTKVNAEAPLGESLRQPQEKRRRTDSIINFASLGLEARRLYQTHAQVSDQQVRLYMQLTQGVPVGDVRPGTVADITDFLIQSAQFGFTRDILRANANNCFRAIQAGTLPADPLAQGIVYAVESTEVANLVRILGADSLIDLLESNRIQNAGIRSRLARAIASQLPSHH